MFNATATIRRDHLTGEYDGKTLTFGAGVGAGEALLEDAEQATFELIDDDGVLYYSGVIRFDDEDALDALFDWGAYDSGTTLLRVDGKDYIG